MECAYDSGNCSIFNRRQRCERSGPDCPRYLGPEPRYQERPRHSVNALSDYYEHGPLVLLQRPVALIGFLGVDQHGLGRDLAALSGLPLIEVDRWIEHAAGQSLVSLVQTQGVEALRQLEDRFLAQALATRPPGIVVLGDGALLKEANLQQVLAKATLVYLKLSLASTYWKLRHQAIGSHLLLQPPDSTAELRPLLALRQGGFDQAHVTLDMDAMTPEAALRHLLDKLPKWGQRGP